MNRREFLCFLRTSALSGISMLALDRVYAAGGTNADDTKTDLSLRIAPLKLELSPGKTVATVGYNGVVPGPLLRVKEGQRVTIEVLNRSDVAELVHWHGLMVPSDVDGAMEEGTPMVPAGGRARYSFVARPAGTRWYHTHAIAGKDLRRSLYSGQYGFFTSNRRRTLVSTIRRCSSRYISGSRTS